MGAQAGVDVDAWVREGGIVVAASERARRALLSAYHRARRAEGLAAWITPAIYDWNSFVRQRWMELATDGRLLLSGTQEQALWARVIAEQGAAAALLREPLRRMAAMAMDGHTLLCAYAPRFLDARARGSWRQDAATFSGWLAEFDEACRREALVSAARLPLELIAHLESSTETRPPVLLVGFDRLLPVQHQLFEKWGRYQSGGGASPCFAIAVVCSAGFAKRTGSLRAVVSGGIGAQGRCAPAGGDTECGCAERRNRTRASAERRRRPHDSI